MRSSLTEYYSSERRIDDLGDLEAFENCYELSITTLMNETITEG